MKKSVCLAYWINLNFGKLGLGLRMPVGPACDNIIPSSEYNFENIASITLLS